MLIAHKIFGYIFIQFFWAVCDYKIQLGVIITDVKRDCSEKLRSVSVTITDLNIFIFYFDKAIGRINIKKSLWKSVKECTATVINDEEKPALLTWNCKKYLI